VFDIKRDYQRAIPHYEEALAIKNAIAGFSSAATSLGEQVNPDASRALVLKSLASEDDGYCKINKATLSASVTRHKIAMVHVKVSVLQKYPCFASVRTNRTHAEYIILSQLVVPQLRKYDHALFHFAHALRIRE
jgi:tetratricopeptide (TPR) repeat protein